MNANKEATWDEWTGKVLLLLVGKNKPFQDGFQATSNVDFDILRDCWDLDMNQYEAADYYLQTYWKLIDMKPREWLRQRREKMEADGIISYGRIPCSMFSKRSDRKISIKTMFWYCTAMAFMAGIGIGALIMYWAEWM